MTKIVALISSGMFLLVCLLSAQPPAAPAPSSTTSFGQPAEQSQLDLPAGTATGIVFDGRLIDAIEFFKPHEGGNGRSCATCHRPEDNFGLTPATVEARYQLWQVAAPTRSSGGRSTVPVDRRGRLRSRLHDAANQGARARGAAAAAERDARRRSRRRRRWRSGGPCRPSSTPESPRPFRRTAGWARCPSRRSRRCVRIRKSRRTRVTACCGGWPAFRSICSRRSGSGISRDALAAGAPLPNPEPPLNRLEREGKATFTQFCASCHGGATQTVNTDATIPSRAPARPPARCRRPSSICSCRRHVRRPFSTVCRRRILPERTYLVTLPDGDAAEHAHVGSRAGSDHRRCAGIRPVRCADPVRRRPDRTVFPRQQRPHPGRRRQALPGAVRSADVLRESGVVRAGGERSRLRSGECGFMPLPERAGPGTARVPAKHC